MRNVWMIVAIVTEMLWAATGGATAVWAAEKPKVGTGEGTVESVGELVIHVKGKDNSKITLVLPDPVKAKIKIPISVKGALTPGQLQTGMYITFFGVLKGNAMEGEIAEGKLVSLNDGFKPGVEKSPLGDSTSILGRIDRVDGEKVVVNVLGRVITATFAKTAKIQVDSTDYKAVRPGDKISYQGTQNGDKVSIRRAVVTVGESVEPAAKITAKPKAKAK